MMTQRLGAMAAVWLVCLFLASTFVAGQKAASPEQGPQYLNMVSWKAGSGLPVSSLLVADAFSLYSKGKALNNGGCKQLAMRLQGANAWAFCANKAGCGNACAAYTKANPTLPIGNKSPVGRAYWSRPLPVKGVGYWTYPLAGLKGCALDAKGKPTDKWAFGTCRILKVADAKKPQLQSKAAGAGWLYGTIVRDAKCGSLLSSTCAACMASTNPLSCLACSKGFYIKPANALLAMLAPTLDAESAQQSACVRCAAMPYGTTTYRCIQCVARRKKCNICAVNVYAPDWPVPKLPDLPSCINCAWDENLLKLDEKIYTPSWVAPKDLRASVCRECTSRPPSQRIQCAACLMTFSKTMCPHESIEGSSLAPYSAKFGAGCHQPASSLRNCDAGYKADAAKFTQCVKKGVVDACADCLNYDVLNSTCMDCKLQGRNDCTTCYTQPYWSEEHFSNGQCEFCLTDKTVTNKSYCTFCSGVGQQDWPDYHVDYDFCHACIRDPKTTDFTTCEKWVTS